MSLFESLWQDTAEKEGFEGNSSEEGTHAEGVADNSAMEKKKTHAEELYLDMFALADNNEDMQKQFTEIKKSIVSYISKRQELNAIAKESREGVGRAGEEKHSDRDQKIMHDALIDNLNIYSRMCVRFNKDNSWRGELGDDRKMIASWAIKVFDLVKKDLDREGQAI